MTVHRAICFSLLLTLQPCLTVHAAANDRLVYETALLRVHLMPRTAQQMAAFYEARGFSQEMIAILNDYCFITVAIGNNSDDIIWLDLANWRFNNPDGTVHRENRTDWRNRWTAMQIPLAHQSTFRWTLLPEQLDFRPGENEAGNITLPRRGKPLNITARFDRGEQREGEPILINFNAVQCAGDP